MADSGSDQVDVQARQAASRREHLEVVLRSVKVAVGVAGYDSNTSRVAAVLEVSGQAIDAMFGDVILHQGGLIAIVDLPVPEGDETQPLREDVETSTPHEAARLILLAFPQGTQSEPTIWIL